MSVALPHLIFLTLAGLGAWAVAAIDQQGWDTPTTVGAVVTLGAGAGMLIGAWT